MSNIDSEMDLNKSIGSKITKEAVVTKKSTKDKKKLIEKPVVDEFFLFRNNVGFKQKWDMVVMISALFNSFSIPFKVAFQPVSMNSIAFFYLNLLIDFTFALDMIITFRTCYIDDYGNEVNKPLTIA